MFRSCRKFLREVFTQLLKNQYTVFKNTVGETGSFLYCRGVRCIFFLKTFEKYKLSLNPTFAAIFLIGISVRANRAQAALIRCSAKY